MAPIPVYDPKEQFSLDMDASGYGIGAILSQVQKERKGSWHPEVRKNEDIVLPKQICWL